MALGEWLSVQSARELYQRQIALEREELETAPAEEQEELALIYQAKGIPADRAREVAAGLMKQPRTALDTLAREELGIDPQHAGGSAWTAAPGRLWTRSGAGYVRSRKAGRHRSRRVATRNRGTVHSSNVSPVPSGPGPIC